MSAPRKGRRTRPRLAILLGAILPWASLVAAPAAAASVAESVRAWRPHVAEASARFGVPADWIERVMRAESGGRTRLGGRPIRSAAGAIGLMQVMPGTWARMRAEHGLGPDPDDPRDNILAGTAYLRAMYDRFGYPGLFAAYNAGPGRYAAHLATGRALPGETRAYMTKLTGGIAVEQDRSAVGPAEALFVALRSRGQVLPASGEPGRPNGLFVTLSRR